MDDYKARDKQRLINNANADLALHEAMLVLADNNDFACEITIMGLKIGVFENKRIIPVIKANIVEIKKFLAGKPNKWE